MSVDIRVSPKDGFIDDPLDIVVDGLPEEASPTVVSRFRYRGTTWRGEATFSPSGRGSLDLSKHEPTQGDYDSANPMGLIQFARPIDERSEAQDSSESDIDGFQLQLTVRLGDRLVAKETVTRRSLAAEVELIHLEELSDRFVGDLFLPPGEGPHPGLLFLGGSEGGIPSNARAKLLASRGYAVLSLGYFQSSSVGGDAGNADREFSRLPERLVEVPLEYFEDAAAWLATCDRVDENRLGVIGGSRGSEPAVLVAARVEHLSSIVVIAPLAYAFSSFQEVGEPAWTEDGDPISYLTNRFRLSDLASFAWNRAIGGGARFGPTFRSAVERASPQEREAAALPVERADAPILAVAGEDDELGHSAFMCSQLSDRSAEGITYHCYPEAGHLLSVPYTPVRGRSTGDEPVFFGMPLAYGGTPEGYATADEHSWNRILSFLERTLRSQSTESSRANQTT